MNWSAGYEASLVKYMLLCTFEMCAPVKGRHLIAYIIVTVVCQESLQVDY